MLYYITTIVNHHSEFRTALNENGELGIYSEMLPCYTVFHKDTETFSNLWTAYNSDFEAFCVAYERMCGNTGVKKAYPANQMFRKIYLRFL